MHNKNKTKGCCTLFRAAALFAWKLPQSPAALGGHTVPQGEVVEDVVTADAACQIESFAGGVEGDGAPAGVLAHRVAKQREKVNQLSKTEKVLPILCEIADFTGF